MGRNSSITLVNTASHHTDEAIATYNVDPRLSGPESEIIAEFFPEAPAQVLDIGCGNGRTTLPLHQMGYQVVGLDLCEPLTKLARERDWDVSYVVGDVRNLSFPDAYFDAVLFSANGLDYMCPLSERLRALEEIRRVLKPECRFVFSSHNALGCVRRLFKPVGLTLVGLRFLLDQVPPDRYMLDWYFRWRDAVLGMPVFYSAPPAVNLKVLENAGWAVLATRGSLRPDAKARTLSDVHVYYVCERQD